jgi:hypothetical protein
MNKPRLAAAFFLAPLSIWTPFIAVAPFIHFGLALIAIGFIAVLIAYAGMLLVGVPVISLLNHCGATKWWQLTLAGAPVPALLTLTGGAPTALFFGSCGAFVALVAWFVAYR